jgi:hypothetical protein
MLPLSLATESIGTAPHAKPILGRNSNALKGTFELTTDIRHPEYKAVSRGAGDRKRLGEGARTTAATGVARAGCETVAPLEGSRAPLTKPTNAAGFFSAP